MMQFAHPQHWDDRTVTDVFTLNQMRYAGAH